VIKKISVSAKIFVKKYKIIPVILLFRLSRWLVRYVKYNIQYFTKAKKLCDGRFKGGLILRWPCLNDATATTGFDAHYIYHTSWAARIVIRQNPEYHVDISSSLYFVALTSAVVPVIFYDYRPAEITLPGLECQSADITNLPFEDNSVKSLSCMHVMEHIGLGRYGDPFDPKGDLKGIAELERVLSPGGSLLFVVPIGGEPILQFNAHRIYTYSQIVERFDGLKLMEFALISDDGQFLERADEKDADCQSYGCGCFLFEKPSNDPLIFD
jgi:SAM-dependent methyltransferase